MEKREPLISAWETCRKAVGASRDKASLIFSGQSPTHMEVKKLHLERVLSVLGPCSCIQNTAMISVPDVRAVNKPSSEASDQPR